MQNMERMLVRFDDDFISDFNLGEVLHVVVEAGISDVKNIQLN